MTADNRFKLRIPFISPLWESLRSSTQDSFFIRRRPKWNFPKDWQRPAEDEYQQELHWEGFISTKYWEDDDLDDYPLIAQDLRDIEEYLMPVFWEFNQKAKFYQNSFYKYQWIFMFGAFFTTILAVLTGYYGGLDATDTKFLVISADTDLWVNLFGVLTAIVSAVTSYYTVLSNQGEPRKRWASYRRLTEELRMIYFRYISRTEPYSRENRVDVLRRGILEIRRQEQENG